MINPDLQPGKPVQTRGGLEAVIYAVHEGQEYPIICAFKDDAGFWVPFMRRADGTASGGSPTSSLDLIPAPKKLTGFINVYEDGATKHETREHADMYHTQYARHRDRIACLDLSEHNLTEGHGLTEGSSDA